MEHPTVLVFVEFPNPKFPTAGFINNLAYPDVELVGFYHLDDGETAQAAQADHEDEFTAELREQAERFEEEGVRTEYDLVFDHNQVEARQQVAERDEVDAILITGGANTLGNVLIASRHTRNAREKMSTLFDIVDRDDLITVDLIHVANPDDPDGELEGEKVLEEVSSILTDEGIPSVQINREVRTGEDVSYELSNAARNYDLIVLGETEQDLGDRIFGPVGDYIADEQDVSSLIIR